MIRNVKIKFEMQNAMERLNSKEISRILLQINIRYASSVIPSKFKNVSFQHRNYQQPKYYKTCGEVKM